jgi:3-oxoacyl-[acyl-carrier-protein] synthase II
MASIMRIAVRGIGVAGGFGCGADQLRRALLSGESTPQNILIAAESRNLEFPVYLCDTSRLADFVNKRALRRVDHFSRMAVLASALALEDAGMLQEDHQNFAVVVASGYGATRTTFSFLDSVIDDGDACASPTLFSNSVHNAAAAHISILLKAKGPNVTVSQFEMSVPSALLTACCWLQEKGVDAVIFGGVDEYCNVLGYSWQRFFGLDHKADMRPLEFNNQSAIAGEGAAFFLLTPGNGDKPKYGYIADVQMGHGEIIAPKIPENSLLILGADGHKLSGIHYARYAPPGNQAAIYSPLYGSIPIGPAFDIAIAALSIKECKAFATSKCAGDNSALNIVWQEQDLNSKPICCLKFSCSGEFGMIKLVGE